MSSSSGLKRKAFPARFMLYGISFSHLLNDLTQSLLVGVYPLLRNDFDLSFLQLGIITLFYQFSASLFQPVIGLLSDHYRPSFLLPFGMLLSAGGLALIAVSTTYELLLMASILLGSGSSIFHPAMPETPTPTS